MSKDRPTDAATFHAEKWSRRFPNSRRELSDAFLSRCRQVGERRSRRGEFASPRRAGTQVREVMNPQAACHLAKSFTSRGKNRPSSQPLLSFSSCAHQCSTLLPSRSGFPRPRRRSWLCRLGTAGRRNQPGGVSQPSETPSSTPSRCRINAPAIFNRTEPECVFLPSEALH